MTYQLKRTVNDIKPKERTAKEMYKHCYEKFGLRTKKKNLQNLQLPNSIFNCWTRTNMQDKKEEKYEYRNDTWIVTMDFKNTKKRSSS